MDNIELALLLSSNKKLLDGIGFALQNKLALENPVAKNDINEVIKNIDISSILIAFIKKAGLKLENVTNNKEIIDNYAYQDRIFLNTLDLQNAANIGSYAMQNCIALTSLDLLNVTSVSDYAMYNCISLTKLDLPNVTSIGNSAMQNCISLTSLDLPNVTSIGNSAMRNCISLTSLDLLNVTSIGNSAIRNCISLTSLDLPNVTSIGNGAMLSCTSLAKLKIGANQVVTLSNTNALQGTQIAAGKGYIYVPDNLVESYKTATNWSVYASQIKPMSAGG